MDVIDWLTKLKINWGQKNIDGVLSLFSPDVLYYETPFHKLLDFNEIRKEWEVIKDQNQISFEFNVFSGSNNKFTVQWDLKYSNNENIRFHFKGLYLITLNKAGLCDQFIQYCEENK